MTRSPSETWTAQQLREITPFTIAFGDSALTCGPSTSVDSSTSWTSPLRFGEGADVIIRDRAGKFGGEFDRVAKGARMRIVKTPVRTPNMNRSAEVHGVELCTQDHDRAQLGATKSQ